MPKRYLRQVEWPQAREHARIARARGGRPVHAELFGVDSDDGPGLCVVAPDAPGLLAAISVALMLEGFDIRRADAYTRQLLDAGREAVDLFWVRHYAPEATRFLSETNVRAVALTLTELVGREGALHVPPSVPVATTPGTAGTTVRFHDNPGTSWWTLVVESSDRTGLLAAITTALFSEGVQIVGSKVRTEGSRAIDRFDFVEGDGAPISGTRLQRIELAVLAAVDDRSRTPQSHLGE